MIQELYHTVLDTLQNQLPTVIAYAAVLLVVLYKEMYIRRMKKTHRQLLNATTDAVNQVDRTKETNRKLTAERLDWLKQLKRERELKGEYRQQLESLKNELKRA